MTLPWPLLWLLTTGFRLFPWPTRTGLRAIGQPGPDAPVLLTCNFALTVARVERALRGLDGWLLVADSRGINVWCAAAGGHLTTHDAISALKTTPIAERVTHRRVILPQLAAVGIEADSVRERAGWEVVWGPVDAADLPAFLGRGSVGRPSPNGGRRPSPNGGRRPSPNGGRRSSPNGGRRSSPNGGRRPSPNGGRRPSPNGGGNRQVRFDLHQRLEMAVMYAGPLSLLALVALLFWPAGFLPLLGLIWGLALAVYLAFPLYEPLVRRGSLAGFVAIFGGLTLAGVALAGAMMGCPTLPFLMRWGGLGLGMVLLLASDLAGSTPLYKSWTQPERRYRVALEPERCIGCGRCAQVCPRGVFAVAEVASLPHTDRCEQCGACIVQCPTDGLAFITPSGERVPPEVVRRCKLNLLGRRG